MPGITAILAASARLGAPIGHDFCVINLSDNLHYALNTKLPGKKDDLYSIKFTILPPETSKLGLHYDWREEVGPVILETFTFEYKNLDFSEIASSKRR